MNQFIGQLRRRNVFRVAAAYVIVGWIILQAADLFLETFGAPQWVEQTLTLLVVLGFPLACIFAWAFELTPEGIKRSHEVDEAESITHQTGRKLDLVIVVLLLALIGLTAWQGNRPAPEPSTEPQLSFSSPEPIEELATTSDKTRIAVLPFVNMSDDPGQEFFSDGISEEILNSLVSIEGLEVASRTSSFAYKGSVQSIRQIAAALEVGFILEGSVRKAGDTVRITAQLIDTSEDRHLWSETYDRDLADIFAIQSEIANAIATSLQATLGQDEAVVVEVPVSTENLDAYETFLKGRELLTRRSRVEDVAQALELLETSLSLDPEFLDARETLAIAYSIYPEWIVLSPEEDQRYFQTAERLADEVLAKDPLRDMPWVVKAGNYDLDFGSSESRRKAREAYQHALELNPRNIYAHHWHAMTLADQGYLQQALDGHLRCLEIDPHHLNCIDHAREVLSVMGRHDEAMLYLERYLGYDDVAISLSAVWTAEFAGNRAAALSLAQGQEDWADVPVRELFQIIDGESIDEESAYRLMQQMPEGYVYAGVMTFMALLGLEPAPEKYTDYYGWFWHPVFQGWRQTDRFKQIMRETSIYDSWQELGFPPQCRPLDGGDFECD